MIISINLLRSITVKVMDVERKSSRAVKKPDFYAPPAVAVVRQLSDGDESEIQEKRSRNKKTKTKTRVVVGASDTEESEHETEKVITNKKPKAKGAPKSKEIKITKGSFLGEYLNLNDHRAICSLNLSLFVVLPLY